MILNTGNRTDIPAFYSKWFMNRIREGYVLTRNPFSDQLIQYDLSPDLIDIITFCTKNPIPMLPYIYELMKYRMYWHITITPYGKEIEPHIPNKNRIMDAVKILSNKLGKECVVWRYDPIFINEKYTIDYHLSMFEAMCQRLSGYVSTCIISFIDLYEKTKRNFPDVKEVSLKHQELLCKQMVEIGKKYHISISTCLENQPFMNTLDINVDGCYSREVLEKAFHIHLNIPESTHTRVGCQCVLGHDIGMYNTCLHGCLYCYANVDRTLVEKNYQKHNPNSPLLIGEVKEGEKIYKSKQVSYINPQLDIFDF